MRLLFTALACLLSVSLSAQEQVITYPYNPDADTDSLIAVPDALEFLTIYGNEFIPEPVTVDGIVITEWISSINDSLLGAQTQIDSVLAIINQGIPVTQGNTCRVSGQAVYNWQGGYPYYYSVPSTCSFVWVSGMETVATCGCNYVSADQHRILLDENAPEGTIRSFVCETNNYYCPSLYQYIDGVLTEITTLPSYISGGSSSVATNYRTVQFTNGIWVLMPDESPIVIGVD